VDVNGNGELSETLEKERVVKCFKVLNTVPVHEMSVLTSSIDFSD